MSENQVDKIKYGRYKSFDDKYIYVFDAAMNVDTGEKLVLYYNSSGKQKIYCMLLSAFFAEIELNGKTVNKYELNMPMSKPSVREQIVGNDKAWVCTYYDYAKEILTEYNDRVKTIRESARIKIPYEVTLEELKEYVDDNNYLKHCLKTHLEKYMDIFIECFKNGKSIRDYAKEKNMNRGSVEHLRNKLISEFAALLEARDKSNRRNRLAEKKKKQSEWIEFDF